MSRFSFFWGKKGRGVIEFFNVIFDEHLEAQRQILSGQFYIHLYKTGEEHRSEKKCGLNELLYISQVTV